jgi:hypothetical protein
MKSKAVKNLENRVVEFMDRVETLEAQVKIMQCTKHDYEKEYRYYCSTGSTLIKCKCKKCGLVISVPNQEWHDIQLDQALDEVERLGGEVTR